MTMTVQGSAVSELTSRVDHISDSVRVKWKRRVFSRKHFVHHLAESLRRNEQQSYCKLSRSGCGQTHVGHTVSPRTRWPDHLYHCTWCPLIELALVFSESRLYTHALSFYKAIIDLLTFASALGFGSSSTRTSSLTHKNGRNKVCIGLHLQQCRL